MTEFIGSRISLISKRDIRYVGTLHEISSENSTVALEQVVSFGTEGRRPNDEVLPSDNVYEYIVFRGSDVKDLRIEEPPKENKPPKPPQVPDDPAILGSARRPTPASAQQPQTAPLQAQNQQPQNQQPAPQQPAQQRQPPPPQFQQPPFPYYYPPPPNQRFGPQGFPPGPGFPGMPYGAPPPGWYPPPGHGFPNMPPGQFHPHQMPIGPPGPQQFQKVSQPQQSSVEAGKPSSKPQSPKPVATVKLPSSSTTPIPPVQAQTAPPPPTESKPDVAAALAPPAPPVSQTISTASQATPTPSNDIPVTNLGIPTATKPIPTGPKSGRIIPAVPLPSPRIKMPAPPNGTVKLATASTPKPVPAQAPAQAPPRPVVTKSPPVPTRTLEEATRDARAAVAAAMAKLPPAPGQKKQVDGQSAMDNLTKKVNEMRTNDNIRTSRQPGTGGYVTGHRGGGRGNYRGGRPHSEQQGKKVEVPTTDYDFASANAKFNKQDLVKEAIATGSPIEAATTNGNDVTEVNGSRQSSELSIDFPSGVGYNKSSSFFDNISSESKDRTEDGGNRLGGREFRTEERQKNLETFGQGSVDNGYRGGFRGGRARGRGFTRGAKGGYAPRAGGRGGLPRGGRGPVAAEG